MTAVGIIPNEPSGTINETALEFCFSATVGIATNSGAILIEWVPCESGFLMRQSRAAE